MAKFIVFEGIDGSGKTTQIKLLCEALRERGIAVDITREPTDGKVGKKLRQCLTGECPADLTTIATLFAEDRLDHINREGGILDTLAQGTTLLCDRYYLSSYAYQSVDCDLEWIISLNSEAQRIARPDLHIFLDVPADQSMARVTSRGETELFEQLERQQQIRDNFFRLFEMFKDKENVLVVSGVGKPERIASEILEKVLPLFQ